MKKKRTYYQDNLGLIYDDKDLWESASKSNKQIVEVKKVLRRMNKRDREIVLTLADDFKRMTECKMHPIIFTPDGYLADGFHRLAVAILDSMHTIDVVKLKKMPKPKNQLKYS